MVSLPRTRKQDEHHRFLFRDSEVPDPWTPESRFALWRNGVCGPWSVFTVSEKNHRIMCSQGWIRSGDWWFVCGDCHPDAVDTPTESVHQMRTVSVDSVDEIVDDECVNCRTPVQVTVEKGVWLHTNTGATRCENPIGLQVSAAMGGVRIKYVPNT